MKKLIMVFMILSLIFISLPIYAEIPHYMQFQGKATDNQDVPLTGSYNLTFRIYDVEIGGSAIWTETHTGVSIENGVFSVLLGGVNPLNLAFDKPYWISTEIGTVDGTNELPRQPITSAGYAYKSKEAEHAIVADTVTEVVIETRTDDPANPKPGQMWLRMDIE